MNGAEQVLETGPAVAGAAPARPAGGTPSTRSNPTALRLGWTAISLGTVAAALVLPWHVPVRGDVVGVSVMLGFANAVCHKIIAAGLVLCFGWMWATQPAGTWIRSHPALEGFWRTDPSPLARQTRRLAVAASMATALFVVAWWRWVPEPYFGETPYFLSRLDLFAAGAWPYRDFEFGYGPALIYGPWILYRVGHGLISIEDAYVASVAVWQLAGSAMIWYVVRRMGLPPRTQGWLGVGAIAVWVNVSLGAQYAPARFAYEAFAVVAGWVKLAGQAGEDAGGAARVRNAFRRLGGALLLGLGGLLISPDTGIITLLGLAALYAWSPGERRAVRVCELAGLGGAVAVLYALVGPGYFHTVFGFGSGALCFPVLGVHYILCYLAGIFLVIPTAALRALMTRSDRGAVWAGLATIMALRIPIALGRCDPGHVVGNGFSLLLVGAGLGCCLQKPLLRWTAGVLVGVTVAASFASTGSQFSGLVLSASGERMLEAVGWLQRAHLLREPGALQPSTEQWADARSRVRQESLRIDALMGDYAGRGLTWSKPPVWSDDLLPLLGYDHVGTPFGVSPEIERFLKATGRYVAGYHVPPSTNVLTRADVARHLEDLGTMETIVAPKVMIRAAANHWSAETSKPDERAEGMLQAELRGIYVWPVNLKVQHPPFDHLGPLLRRVLAGYTVTGEVGPYYVMRRHQ